MSGSIKARGGIYAVLRIVDSIAVREGIFDADRTFSLSGRSREVFSGYTVSVGSTGNLGLSIGIAGRAFGLEGGRCTIVLSGLSEHLGTKELVGPALGAPEGYPEALNGRISPGGRLGFLVARELFGGKKEPN